MLKKYIERWKYKKDMERGGEVYNILRKFYSPVRRKDLVVELAMHVDYTTEELEEFSHLLGRLAHERERDKT